MIEAIDASDVLAPLSVLVENFTVVPGTLALVPIVLLAALRSPQLLALNLAAQQILKL